LSDHLDQELAPGGNLRPSLPSYTVAAIAGLFGGLLATAAGFMHKFKTPAMTFTLLPAHGPGYLQRLAVNVTSSVVIPLVGVLASAMLLRKRAHHERWSGALFGSGLMYGILAANRFLAEPYSGTTWLAGQWIATWAYVFLFVAAVLVGWMWFATRASSVKT